MEEHLRLIENMRQCTLCELHQDRTKVVVGDYGPKGGLCFIGEAPGHFEDLQGRPFVGKSGQLLDQMLSHIGMTREDVSVLNINKCRPPNNRNPTKKEMHICGTTWLDHQLTHLQPKLLVVLGSTALRYFLPDQRITQAKGNLQIMADGPPILPLFHPAYVLRGGQSLENYKQDFVLLLSLLDQFDTSATEVTKTEKPTLDDYFDF